MMRLTRDLNVLNEDVIEAINAFQAEVPISDEAQLLVCGAMDQLCAQLHRRATDYLHENVDGFMSDIWGPFLPPSADMMQDMFLRICSSNRGVGYYAIRNLETFIEQLMKFAVLIERWWVHKFERWTAYGRARYYDQLQNIGVDNSHEWGEYRHAAYREAVASLMNYLIEEQDRFQYPLEKEDSMMVDTPFLVNIQDDYCAFYQVIPGKIHTLWEKTFVDPTCLHYIDGMDQDRTIMDDMVYHNMTYVNVRIPRRWNDIYLPHYALPMMNFTGYNTTSTLTFNEVIYSTTFNDYGLMADDEDDVITI